MCWFSELASLAKSWHMNWCARLWALRSRRKCGIFDGSRRLTPLRRNAAGRLGAACPKLQVAEINGYRKAARKMTTPALSIPKETNPLRSLADFGQSVWLDYIRRSLITSGELKRLVVEDGLRGVTSNPAIFEKGIVGSTDYESVIESKESASLDGQGLY